MIPSSAAAQGLSTHQVLLSSLGSLCGTCLPLGPGRGRSCKCRSCALGETTAWGCFSSACPVSSAQPGNTALSKGFLTFSWLWAWNFLHGSSSLTRAVKKGQKESSAPMEHPPCCRRASGCFACAAGLGHALLCVQCAVLLEVRGSSTAIEIHGVAWAGRDLQRSSSP